MEKMKGLLQQLESQKAAHKEAYDSLTVKVLLDRKKPVYVPRIRTREELLDEVKHKTAWNPSTVSSG